jgi:hypothetical protein
LSSTRMYLPTSAGLTSAQTSMNCMAKQQGNT